MAVREDVHSPAEMPFILAGKHDCNEKFPIVTRQSMVNTALLYIFDLLQSPYR